MSGGGGLSHYWGNWANNVPVAGVKADSVVCVSKQVTFDGSDSYDPDGVITEWRWDPGDGTGYLYGKVVTYLRQWRELYCDSKGHR
jgi:hypothetical protein